jgi:hypothetical protein
MLLAPRLATATPEYPEAVDMALGTACPDPNSRCLMCHTTGEADKEELVRCGNPSGEDLGIGPEYGCDGARLAPLADRSSVPVAGALACVLVGIVLCRRARRSP